MTANRVAVQCVLVITYSSPRAKERFPSWVRITLTTSADWFIILGVLPLWLVNSHYISYFKYKFASPDYKKCIKQKLIKVLFIYLSYKTPMLSIYSSRKRHIKIAMTLYDSYKCTSAFPENYKRAYKHITHICTRHGSCLHVPQEAPAVIDWRGWIRVMGCWG